jgi:hypothetical protein
LSIVRRVRRAPPFMNIPLKTSLVLMVAIATFNLGRYSVEFSGSAAAWAAVVSCLVILAVSVFALIFWRPNA